MKDRGWTATDVPDQHGRRIVLTGANSGIGLEAARVLAARGAEVVLACRNLDKGHAALGEIKRQTPAAAVTLEQLDLADLADVRAFAARVNERPIDVLVDNAGVMALHGRRTTADGFELQLGTNHLGHVALTLALLPALLAADDARVVVVSSQAHVAGDIDFDDLNAERRYRRWTAYSQSKLANLLFMYELQRRFEAAGLDAMAVGCHPGYAATDLQRKAVGGGAVSWVEGPLMSVGNRLFAQSAAAGAWPTLRATTDPDARGGDYFGPASLGGQRGRAVRAKPTNKARDPELARRLWEVSLEMTAADPGPLGP